MSNRLLHIYAMIIYKMGRLPYIIKQELLHYVEHELRKVAHLIIYAVLGITTTVFVRRTIYRKERSPWRGLGICINECFWGRSRMCDRLVVGKI